MHVYGACLYYVCCSDCVGSVGMFFEPWGVEVGCVFV